MNTVVREPIQLTRLHITMDIQPCMLEFVSDAELIKVITDHLLARREEREDLFKHEMQDKIFRASDIHLQNS